MIDTTNINIIDIIAPIWFMTLWLGYSQFADSTKQKNLVNAMQKYRIYWIKNSIRRSERLVDTRIIESLLQSTTFLASTSILIIGGLVAILGYGEKALPIIQSIPFADNTDTKMWITKTTLMLTIFIYSFFKFTWVIRQFNYALVLLLSAPQYNPDEKNLKNKIRNTHRCAEYVHKISTMTSNAGKHFNMGVRSYYFGLVALSWYINSVLFIVMSILVVLVIYRREFISKTLTLLE